MENPTQSTPPTDLTFFVQGKGVEMNKKTGAARVRIVFCGLAKIRGQICWTTLVLLTVGVSARTIQFILQEPGLWAKSRK
jgi:hypothetical protein